MYLIQAFLVPILVVVVPPVTTYWLSKRQANVWVLVISAILVSLAVSSFGFVVGNWLIGLKGEVQPEMRLYITWLMVVPVNMVLALCFAPRRRVY